MKELKRISNRSVGQYDSRKWISEGDGMFASSKITREIWKKKQLEVSEKVKQVSEGESRLFPVDWNLITGLPRASMLLLGYSAEMFLKAGIVRAYHGCSEEMLSRDLKNKFGHNYHCTAQEIQFPLEGNDVECLDILRKLVTVDARYPVLPSEGEKIHEAVNRRTGLIWSDESYSSFSSLVERIRGYIIKIDGDEKNPAFFSSYNIDEDGYVAFRIGGNLPPRITYKVSSEMQSSGKSDLRDIRLILEREPEYCANILIHWDHCFIYEDGKKKTCLRNSARSAPNPHV